jgi:serine protease AprX
MSRKKTVGKAPSSRGSGAGGRKPDGTKATTRGGRQTRKEGKRRAGSAVSDSGPVTSVEVSLPTQVRAAAEREIFRATGEGIVWAAVDSGIDGQHPHFQRHQNLVLDPPLVHRSFTDLEAAAGSGEIDALLDPLGQGTHIAGVIAGELEQSEGLVLRAEMDVLGEGGTPRKQTATLPAISGLAPMCKLVSLKVLNDDGSGNRPNLIEAIRWVREVNGSGRKPLIHGVNVGVQYDWESEWYACGQSPLCVEVNELVKSGVVVVVAAGNGGWAPGGPAMGRAMSISDPGNAEHAMTAGSTNSQDPHTFGVSNFSSAGPTWDGRRKPDLVAPGERVLSCASGVSSNDRLEAGKVRVARYWEMTGTSIAAAYLSGVIAALMSARRELIGQPFRVKQLLLATAEDLNRDRYLQGHGLVNLMRALMETGSVGRLITSGSSEGVDQPQTPREGLGVPARPPASLSPDPRKKDFGDKRFAVALSFPGEHRDYVKLVLWELRRTVPRGKIFYDRYLESELAGPNLSARLQRLYHDDSELIVVFISAKYESKEWCGLEWRAIQDIIKKRRDEEVMPMRFDDTDVPGLFSIDGYIDLRDRDPENVAYLIHERLQANLRKRDVPGAEAKR